MQNRNGLQNYLTSPAANKLSGRFATARKVLADAIATHAFPGCAYGVLASGQVLLHDACGNFTYEEGSPSVAPDTIFDLASVSKVVATTAVAMLLHQRGLLNLDTSLGDILPAFVAGRAQNDYARAR